MERTFVMVKPDGVQRGLVGEVISRLERRGLRLEGMRLMKVSPALARDHYAQHAGRPFFEGLISFITSGPVVVMVWAGKGAVAVVREAMGATDPAGAAPGTIRGDLALDISRNVAHGSDSREAAEREIGLFFSPGDLITYDRAIESWIYE